MRTGAKPDIGNRCSSPAGFRCTLCGECCRGYQKVWLNPIDLVRLMIHLDLRNPDELFSRRIVVDDFGEHGVSRPRLRFVSTPAGSACRFLINDLKDDGCLEGRCALHFSDAKPLVCRLAPLARTVDIGEGSEIWKEIPPVAGCPGWRSDPPPEAGRLIDSPEFESSLRPDLNQELRYFRELSGKLP